MDPIAFHIGQRPIHWYGILVAAAFLAAMAHWTWAARRRGWPASLGQDVAVWAMFGGIIGGRVAYILANWTHYAAAPMEILRVDHGGLVYYGGLAGGALAVSLLALRRPYPFWTFADYAIGGIPLGHALGRVGCFINGCCYGAETDGPLGLISAGARRIPAQLLESAANLIVYAVLLKLAAGRPRPGRVFAAYLMTYGAARFVMEFLRADQRVHLGPLSVAQLFSLAFVLAGAVLWATRRTAAGAGEASPPAPAS